jgi:hypothetical protein
MTVRWSQSEESKLVHAPSRASRARSALVGEYRILVVAVDALHGNIASKTGDFILKFSVCGVIRDMQHSQSFSRDWTADVEMARGSGKLLSI